MSSVESFQCPSADEWHLRVWDYRQANCSGKSECRGLSDSRDGECVRRSQSFVDRPIRRIDAKEATGRERQATPCDAQCDMRRFSCLF
jgi:hypothetical protein